MEMYLDRLEPGLRAVVTQIKSPEPLRCRLRDFGMVTGLELRGTVIALRTCDLKKIRVRLI